MKICYFGIYDPTYSRHSVLLRGLRQNGVEVIECWADWRDPKRYKKLRGQLKALDNGYDCIFAAYPSSVPAIVAKMISKKPVIIDAFYSNYDSVVNDRKKYSRFDPRAFKMLILDWLGVMVSDLVITDTDAHAGYWRTWWGMKNKKFGTVYVGVDDGIFFPKQKVEKDYVQVLFAGTFIPLQGALKIVEAARICSTDSRVRFVFVGDGREFVPAKKLACKYELKNVEFLGMKPLLELNRYFAEADIVLGIFGDRDKTQRVIPNKVYEGLGTNRAVITIDTPAIREIFTEKEILLVNGDSQSIANGIMMLTKNSDLRVSLASEGYKKVMGYAPIHVAKLLITVVSRLI